MLHTLGVAWHQQSHEVFRGLVTIRPFNKDFVNIFVINIADGAFDQVAVGVDQHWCCTAERTFPNFVPKARQIIKVTLDFRLRPGKPSGPDDAAHSIGQCEVRNNGLQTLTVGCAVDFSANATTMRRVWHQYAITACKTQIGCERSALITAFFFDNLNQQNLTTMNNVLDLVTAAQVHALCAHLVACLWCATFAVAASASTTAAVIATIVAAIIATFVFV